MELYALEPTFAGKYLTQLENATVEQIKAAEDRFGNVDPGSLISRDQGSDSAVITITGPLSPNGPSLLARYFGYGGTSYNELISAADSLAEDDSVKSVRMVMNTPGGTVERSFEAREAISRLAEKKSVTAENHGMIASAGYLLASAAHKIVAMSPFSETGSIGVVLAGVDFSEAMSRVGIKEVKIISKNAPLKQAGIATESGRSELQREVDAMERVFIWAVADGRGTTEADVIENFGKGGLLIASDPDKSQASALSVGMIDAVESGVGVSAGAESGDASMGPTTFQDLPMVDQTWDGSAAEKRVRRFLGAEDAPNTAYRKAFFWYNSEEPKNFGSYKLSFADVVDNRLVANIRGVNAANGAMAGARGRRVEIPNADRPRVQSQIDRYQEKWRRQQEIQEGASALNITASSGEKDGDKTMNLDDLRMEHPALYKEAVNVGIAQEHERVEAHLTMGDASGDMKLATACILDKSGMTASISAKYMAAGMKSQASNNRADEAVVALNTPAAVTEDTKDDAVAEALAVSMGVTIDG